LARKVCVDGTTTVEATQDFDGAVRVDPVLCLATAKDRGSRLAPLVKLAAFLGVKYAVRVWKEEPVKDKVCLQTVMVNVATGQEVRAARIKTESGQLRAEDVQKIAQFLCGYRPAGPTVKKNDRGAKHRALSDQRCAQAFHILIAAMPASYRRNTASHCRLERRWRRCFRSPPPRTPCQRTRSTSRRSPRPY
jgi:hypothetical protein